jgi:hypothetical protein
MDPQSYFFGWLVGGWALAANSKPSDAELAEWMAAWLEACVRARVDSEPLVKAALESLAWTGKHAKDQGQPYKDFLARLVAITRSMRE